MPKIKNGKFKVRSKDLPATQGMLALVRNELKADIGSLEKKMDSGFLKVQSEIRSLDMKFGGLEGKFDSLRGEFGGLEGNFDGLRGEFGGLEKKFEGLEKRFDGLEKRLENFELKVENLFESSEKKQDSKFEKMHAEIHRIALLVEEQNSRNRVVLEGLTSLWQRQDKVEKRCDGFEKFVRSLGR